MHAAVNIQRLFISIISFLFLLTPFALLTGPFLPDVLLIIISLLFLYLSFLKKNFYYFDNKYFKFIILFCFIISLRSFFVEKFELSLPTSIVYFRFIIFSLAVWFILENNKNIKKLFFYILLLVFLFLFTDSFFQFFFKKNIFSFWIYAKDRVSSVFGEELILGGVILRLSLVSFPLFIFFFKKNKFFVFLFLLKILLLFLIVIISGERSAFFLMTMQSLLYLLFIKELRKKFFLLLLSIILFLSVFIYFNPLIKERIFDNTFYLISQKQNMENFVEKKNYTKDLIINIKEKNINFFSKGHQSHFMTAYKMFLEEPIFGVGVRMFRYLCAEKRFYTEPMGCNTHPHNTFIQLLAETGLVGFLFFFIIFTYLLKYLLYELIKIFFKKNLFLEDEYKTSLVIALFINLWPFITTGNFFNNYLSFYYYLPVGFFLATLDSKKIKKI
jgi:O-antigen ligase